MIADTDVGPSIASGSHACNPTPTLLMDTMSSSIPSTYVPLLVLALYYAYPLAHALVVS